MMTMSSKFCMQNRRAIHRKSTAMPSKINFYKGVLSCFTSSFDNIKMLMLTRFFDDLERKRSVAMKARNVSEEKALEGFRSARTKDSLLGTLCYK